MANIITLSRIFLAFIVVALLFLKSNVDTLTALILTIFVMWVDGLDGSIARKFNET